MASASTIDVNCCSSSELGRWLSTERFGNSNDAVGEAVNFLMDSVKSLQSLQRPPGDASQSQDLDSVAGSKSVAPALFESNSIEVSCINPRGKFQLSMHQNGIILRNAKAEVLAVPSSSVAHAIVFRKPEDYRKVKQMKASSNEKPLPGHILLIRLEDGSDISFRKKVLNQICITLPPYPVSGDESLPSQSAEEQWWNGLNACLGKGLVRVQATMDMSAYDSGNSYVFAAEGDVNGASSTSAGLPCVTCHQGFNDGALYPLREGLLFFKPPMFIPRSSLASISCGRGPGGSRFVDMMVQLDDDEEEGSKKSNNLEFTNINRDELSKLNDYIHKTLIPAMQADAASESEAEKSDDESVAVAQVLDSDTEEDDVDENEDGMVSGRRSKRAAAKIGRETTKAHFGSKSAEDDSDDDDSDEYGEDDLSDTEGSQDEFEGDSDVSDSDADEPRGKKARVE